MNRRLRNVVFVFAVALVLAWCFPSVGQVIKGSISGTVADAQGAVVPGAQVKAKQNETGTVFNTTTDSSGSFRFNLLSTGTYSVEITAKGFKTAVRNNISVDAGQDSGLGTIRMTVGETSTTVDVTAEAPLIDTTQAQVTNTFSGTTLKSFAGVQENEGLDNLALFVPGVSGSRSNNFSNSNGGGGFTVQGLRGRNNDQQIDGQNNNDNSVGGPGLFLSNPEFVQQYVLITNQFGPEYGRNAGSVVNIITKSGTNSWHGSVYGSEGNSFLNAMTNTQKNFNFKADGKTHLTGPPRSNDEFTGGAMGGPIVKNKVFFFGGFDDELISQNTILATSSITPTPAGLATLAGCFPASQSLAAMQKFGPYGIAGGNPTPTNTTLLNITDPALAAPGNVICPGVQVGGVTRTLGAPFHEFDWVAKNDINLGSDNITARYLFNRGNTFTGQSSGSAAAAAGYPNNVPAISQIGMGSWTHNFSAHMVNEARIGFGRLNVEFGGNSLGNTVATADNIQNAVTNVSFTRGGMLGFGPATNIPQQRIVNTWQAQDNWNYILGKHSFKAGINWTYQRSPNIFLPTLNGAFRFGPVGGPPTPPVGTQANTQGNNFGSFFLNQPNRVLIASGSSSLDFREYDTFAYFGDDWKLNQNLTVNLGATWSYYGQPANLFHDITAPRESGPGAFWATSIGGVTVPDSARIFPEIPAPKNSWGPSAGFAYSPQWGGFLTGHGKTVFRGGYRMLYDPPYYNIYVNIASSTPIVFTQTFTGTQGAPLTTGSFGLPAVATGPNVRALLSSQITKGAFDPRTFTQTTISPDFGPDKVHSWSFGFEREMTRSSALEVRYAGNHGFDLFQSINANPFIQKLATDYPQFIPAGVTPCATSQLAGPGAGVAIGRVNCDQGVIRSRNNSAYSDYHGVQVEFRANNLFKQLTLKTGYTFSKTTDSVSEIFSTGTAGNTSAFAQNPLDSSTGEHGLSGLDFPNRWTLVVVEELPFYREQHGFMGHLLGGWRVSGDYIVGSGQNFTPQQISEATTTGGNYYDNAFNGSFNGFETARPFAGNPNAPLTSVGIFCGDARTLFGAAVNCTSVGNNQLISMNAINGTIVSVVPVTSNDVRFIINTGIAQKLFGTPFGNVGRNTVRDAISNIGNLTVFKNIRFTERTSFEIRATALNVFNHYNFTSVDPALQDAGLTGNFLGFGNPSLTPATGRRFFIGGRFSF